MMKALFWCQLATVALALACGGGSKPVTPVSPALPSPAISPSPVATPSASPMPQPSPSATPTLTPVAGPSLPMDQAELLIVNADGSGLTKRHTAPAKPWGGEAGEAPAIHP